MNSPDDNPNPRIRAGQSASTAPSAEPQQYVARDLPGGGIDLQVGPVGHRSRAELQPVQHHGVGALALRLSAGYNGTGPLDTSLSILVHALDEQPLWAGAAAPGGAPSIHASRARALYRQFMRDVISTMPRHGGWVLPRADVQRWAERTLALPARGAGPLGR